VADDEIAGATEKRYLKQYRMGFAVTAMLLLAIAVTLPFSLASMVDDVLGPATGKVFPLMKQTASVDAAHVQPAPSGRHLHRRDPTDRDGARLRP
jgi:hypothetical protein